MACGKCNRLEDRMDELERRLAGRGAPVSPGGGIADCQDKMARLGAAAKAVGQAFVPGFAVYDYSVRNDAGTGDITVELVMRRDEGGNR